jgi:hypothetical protein
MGDYADAFADVLGEIGCRVAFGYCQVGHAAPNARRVTTRNVAGPRSRGPQEPPGTLEAQD